MEGLWTDLQLEFENQGLQCKVMIKDWTVFYLEKAEGPKFKGGGNMITEELFL
jgi:hypothetical protein